jgi:hypothetical protein
MTISVTDANSHVQKLVSVVKMAAMLEVCTTEERRTVVRFVWTKGLNAKDIHKEMFPVYVGKCLSRKAVHSWIEKRGRRCADDEEIDTEVRKWLRQQSKDFWVRRTDKVMGEMLSVVEDMSRSKCFYLYVLYPLMTYLLTLPRTLFHNAAGR